MRFPDVPSTLIKLILFPFSLEGSARIWLEKEPPRSILTWDDLVSKFINNQGQGLQNQMTNLTKMLSKFITSNTASSSNSRTLPSQTVTNPREHVNAITTRSGKTYEGPSTPLVPTPVVSILSKMFKQLRCREWIEDALIECKFNEGSDELSLCLKIWRKGKNKQFAHAISVIDFSKDEPFSDSTTTHSNAFSPSTRSGERLVINLRSSPMKPTL
ncbi:hypothetical protein Tco_1059192 [Tanacetum coccineum]